MNPLEKSLSLLKRYFKETPRETINKKFEEFNNASFEGVSMREYLENFENEYQMFNNKNSQDWKTIFSKNNFQKIELERIEISIENTFVNTQVSKSIVFEKNIHFALAF